MANNEYGWVGYHVVCLIDLLDQKTKLAKWCKIPPDLRPPADFLDGLEQTVGTILRFQKKFDNYFRQFTLPEVPLACNEHPAKEQRDMRDRYNECRLGRQQFSDTFVFYSPITNTHGDVSLTPVFRILGACCMMMFYSLARGMPIRGGLTVGTGMELAEHNFYGPALAEAYALEQGAGHSRIVVSEEAGRWLSREARFSRNVFIDGWMKELGRACRSLLGHDMDDRLIVDYMGEGMNRVPGASHPGVLAYIEEGYRFICSEATRFQEAADKTQAPRYAFLQKYMDSSLPIWGLQRLQRSGIAR